MDIESIRRCCLAFPHATENVQWGYDLCFKIDGKLFAVTPLEPAPVRLSFKASPENFVELCERPGIIPAPYMARAQWVALAATECRSGLGAARIAGGSRTAWSSRACRKSGRLGLLRSSAQPNKSPAKKKAEKKKPPAKRKDESQIGVEAGKESCEEEIGQGRKRKMKWFVSRAALAACLLVFAVAMATAQSAAPAGEAGRVLQDVGAGILCCHPQRGFRQGPVLYSRARRERRLRTPAPQPQGN